MPLPPNVLVPFTVPEPFMMISPPPDNNCTPLVLVWAPSLTPGSTSEFDVENPVG